jgi:Transcriptional Coactivator p15 (PC4)
MEYHLGDNVRADVMEYHLGDNVYLSAKYHNGVKVVHVRKYDVNGEKRYPTKTGICLSHIRFSSLMWQLDEIDEAYKYVSGMENEWLTVHIGGPLYASVSSGFKCVNFKYFFRASNNKILPSKQGITLTIPIWENLMKFAAELRDNDHDLKSAPRCTERADHMNQLTFLNCLECNPFFDPVDPPSFPPLYSPFLKYLDAPHKSEEPKKSDPPSFPPLYSPLLKYLDAPHKSEEPKKNEEPKKKKAKMQ